FCADYEFLKGQHPLFSGEVLGASILLLGLIALGVWTWRSQRFWAVGLGLLWVGVFMLPVSNLVPMMQYMAERFLYTPIVGWIIALAFLLSMLPRRYGPVLAGALIVLWIPVAWDRSSVWEDDLSLFARSSAECRTQRMQNNAIITMFELPAVKEIFALDTV